ncbi:MAG: sulfotransferase family 2 domain-containing protein [Chromatiales bacterium]|nr:sulfotransferase family 2 domain-containing protein [Chromatiales bacterium]
MIVSHEHRFIYIKTFKTASTSVEAALAPVCGERDIITPASRERMAERPGQRAQNWRLEHPLVPRRSVWRRILGRPERRYHPSVGYYEHMPAWRVRAYLGERIWNEYFKFSFERNPWDRQVSWYHYKTKSARTRPGFDAFLADRKRAWVDNFALYSIDGEIALDFIGRYESLAADFSRVLSTLALEGQVELPRTNVSTRNSDDYRGYYTDQTRVQIGNWYAREIELFGYTF